MFLCDRQSHSYTTEILVKIEQSIGGEELFKSQETEKYPARVRAPWRPRVQPGAEGSSVRCRETPCERNGTGRQALIYQGAVAPAGDDHAKTMGNPMEADETARVSGICRCESRTHVCEGGCDDPVRTVHSMDRCL